MMYSKTQSMEMLFRKNYSLRQHYLDQVPPTEVELGIISALLRIIR
ncbi:hypothetical protein CLV99_1424 [Sphingobacterium yanglingense]|uniref:Uncharacterized protein n=1 Tax=Sphingobacterium yanglingense TaxID=1437280 RepID=A0A4R6WI80_9SPHI|nr:hypothetical protein CLV99_1424 [Sphingobacterium yanglingense]